jgi:hypothetical protein
MPDEVPSNRKTIRQRIEEFFSENLGTEYKSSYLHSVFGSAFRTRVSEINGDATPPVTVRNRVMRSDNLEHSVYWSELTPEGL